MKKELIKRKLAENYETQFQDIHKAIENRKKEREEKDVDPGEEQKITEIVFENSDDDLTSSEASDDPPRK